MGLNTAALTALKDFILARRAAATSGQKPKGQARKPSASATKNRTQLYARGGPIKAQAGGPFIGHAGEEANLGPDHVAPGRHKGGLNQIKECTCGR